MIWITKEKLEELARNAPPELQAPPPRRVIAFDVETPNSRADRICSAGVTVIEGERVLSSQEFRIDPETEFDPFCVRIHGIRPQDVEGEPALPQLWPQLGALLQSGLVIAHNAGFDLGVLQRALAWYGLYCPPLAYADTLAMSRATYKKLVPNHKLGTLCGCFGIPLDAHQAGSDSFGCAELYLKLLRDGADSARFEREYRFD